MCVLASFSNICGRGTWEYLSYLQIEMVYFFPPICITLISFSCLISVTRAPRTTLKQLKEKGLNNLNIKVPRRLVHVGREKAEENYGQEYWISTLPKFLSMLSKDVTRDADRDC